MKTPAQIFRNMGRRDKKSRKKCFTLIEVIIATTLFTTVSLIGVIVFTNVVRIQKRIALENAIYEDGRFLMERISREIRQNAIDYEEYYNKAVQKGAYGQYYGCYASRFYNPGMTSAGTFPGTLGAVCSAPAAAKGMPVQDNPGCVINKTTLDINTGQNPYTGNPVIAVPPLTADSANVFCDDAVNGALGSVPCPAVTATLQDRGELYLIDAKGKKKTIMALKTTNLSPPEQALAMVEIEGEDENKDDIVEKWVDLGTAMVPGVFYCSAGYNCNLAAGQKLENTLDGTDDAKRWLGFVPISPLRTNIKSIHFHISPLEDPRKAFAETDASKAILQQPHVTVTMTLSPSSSEVRSFSGSLPEITLQSTITSRVYNDVRSYTGTGVCPNYPL